LPDRLGDGPHAYRVSVNGWDEPIPVPSALNDSSERRDTQKFEERLLMRTCFRPRAAWSAPILVVAVLGAFLQAGPASASSPPHPQVTIVGHPAPNPHHYKPYPGKRSRPSSRRKGLGQAGGCPDVAGGICRYTLVNDTPYVMTLGSAAHAWYYDRLTQKNYDPPFDIAPAQTLQPGQTTTFQLSQGQAWYSWTQARLAYGFTDVNGGRHNLSYNVDANGNPIATPFDYVGAPFYWLPSATFHVNQSGNESDVVLNSPAVATIDARTQPDTAASVMKMFADGTNKDFKPTTGLSFSTGPYHRVSAVVYNASNEPASLTLSAADTEDETTSLGLKLGWSTSLGILGFADTKISASVTGGHSWTTGTTITKSDEITIKPGWEGWIESAVTSATVTGDFTFTTPQGITYNVLNASVTEPGFGPNGSAGAVEFQPNGKPFSPTGAAKGQRHKRGHRKPKARHRKTRHLRRLSRCAAYHGRVGKTRGCTHWLTSMGDGSVVIDAKADPKGAAAAMALWPGATNQSYVATSNPIYTNTDQTIVSDYYRTPSTWPSPSTPSVTAEQHSSSSWSVGGSVSLETTLSALGFANASVSVEFTAEHQWQNQHSDSQTVAMTIDPGYVGWIEGYQRQVSFTGNYAFTVNGVDYQANNVTITEPGNSEGGQMAAYTYIVKEQKQSSVALRDHRPPSHGPATKLPSLVKNPKLLGAPV